MNYTYLIYDNLTCSLTIENFTADTVSLTYEGLEANQPREYRNFVAIWEATVIPWNAEPLSRQQLPNNGQMGSYVMEGGFTITDDAYIVGYAVGDKITDICAVAYISSNLLMTPPDHVYMTIATIGDYSLSVNYYTLSGYLPKTYKNWIGIWEGYASPYNAPSPVGWSWVNSDSNEGTISIENIKIDVDKTYTLIYFMGVDEKNDWPRTLTNAAAMIRFETTT